MVGMDSKRLEDILKFSIGLVALLLINIISERYFFRLDLTEEKRFSISEPTKVMLKNLEETVYVEVYLDGDLPSGFRRLRTAIEETLEEFRIFSDNHVQYSFVNPDLAGSAKSRNEFMMEIARKGVQPTDVFLTEKGQQIQKRILPGAVVSYGVREQGVLLLKGNKGAPPEEQLNQSVEGVEYELASVIRALTKDKPEIIGLSTGHGELAGKDIFSFRKSLEEKYIVRDVVLNSNADLDGTDLLVIAKPVTKFQPGEKYRLDQYIMKGGRVLFLLDALAASIDSTTISFPYDLNLDDQLFRYGVRINKDLVMDMLSAKAPVVVGNLGDQPQIRMLPWPFYPLINTYAGHPVVRNLDAVKLLFVSSIDTVKAPGIKKTPLLFTSAYSRRLSAPIRIDLDELKKPLDPKSFNQSGIPVACLLEGSFTSLFRNRPIPPLENNGTDVKNDFLESGVPTKIMVIADGDIVRNTFDPRSGQPLPMGFDYYGRYTFANEDFIMNAIEYMLDDKGVILSRNKKIVLRPLDKVKIQAERRKWQILNLLMPVIVLVVFGVIRNFVRKKRYASF